MAVIHILKDGARMDSVVGLVVKYEDCPEVYDTLDRINKRIAKERQYISKEGKQHAEQHQRNR